MALLGTGCGEEPDPAPSMSTEEIGCQDDPRAQRYEPGLSVTGKQYRFVLDAASPAPPARGINQWTLRVLDGNTPVSDASLGVVPFMPDHNHGPAQPPSVTSSDDGRFSIDAIDFFMPGLWRVTVTATEGSVKDSVEFYFCVAG